MEMAEVLAMLKHTKLESEWCFMVCNLHSLPVILSSLPVRPADHPSTPVKSLKPPPYLAEFFDTKEGSANLADPLDLNDFNHLVKALNTQC